jgi:hypothetical protein
VLPDATPAPCAAAASDSGEQTPTSPVETVAGGEFTPGRNQDASATIRGFVYQVELTILRWLALGADQVMQLERGEDIDHITRAASASQAETVRLLEQVKDVQRSLTLHAPGAVIAIGSFCAHRRANPGRDVRFRYTTTAAAGREKLSPLPKGVTGVEAWEQLRRGIKDEAAKATLLTGVRALLRSATRPPDTPDALWTEYTGFAGAATDGDVLAVIKLFEWSFGESSVSDLADEVVRAIRARGTYQQVAELLHDILFAAVFRTLSQPGLKELTVPALESYLAAPKLAESDRDLLVQLKEGFLGHSIRIFALEGRVEAVEIEQRALRAIIGDAGAAPQLGSATPLAVLTEAPLVQSLVRRTQTVQRLNAEAGKATWIAFSGAASTGKSHLAGLLATLLGGPLLWFGLRGLETRVALDRVRATMSDAQGAATAAAWVAALPPATVLVFDDLGLLRSGSAEATTWLDVVRAFKRAGVRVITTGDAAPTPALIETLAKGDVSSTAVPMFDDGEVRELLAARGAPSEFMTDSRVTMLRGLTAGHPALLRAAADYLAQQRWKFDQDILTQLLAGGHAHGLTVETSRRVVETITLEGCRELLYRLCVIRDAVTQDEIRQTALVDPARSAYLECVQNLEGLWLQPAGGGLYEVSPLVLAFGAQQLNAAVAARVNRFAARRLLSRGTIDPIEFMRALMHIMGAGDYNQAVSLLIRELANRRSAKALGPEWPLILFPPEKPLPPSLLPGLGMALRSHQVVAASRQGREVSAYWQSLVAMMEGAVEQDHWGVLLAANQLLTARSLPAPQLIAAARQLERVGGRAPLPNGEQIETPGWDQGVDLWLVTPAIKTWAELWMWIELLGSIDAERLRQVMASPEAAEVVQPVVERLFIAAAEGQAGGGSIRQALEQLRRLEDWAVLHKADLLTACAIRGQMVIAGEYEKRHEDMEAFAKRGLQLVAGVGAARGLLELTYGSQLNLAGKHEAAIPHLEEAASSVHGQIPLNRVFALLSATEAAFAIGRPSSAYAEAALLEYDADGPADASLKATVLAEVAVSRWQDGRRPEAFDAIESAVSTVLTAKPTEAIQSLTVRIGHALGYFTTLATKGSPPNATDSGEAYLAPSPSMFRAHNSAAASMFRARTGSAMLMAQLSALASRVERTERSHVWAESAFAEATTTGFPATTLFVAPAVLDAQVRAGEPAAAIETAFVAARALRALNQERAAGRDPIRDDLSIDLRPGPPPSADDLDELALQFVLLPMVLWVCEEYLRHVEAGQRAVKAVGDAIARLGRPVLPSDKWAALHELLQLLLGDAPEKTVTENVRYMSQAHPGLLQAAAYLLVSAWPKLGFASSALVQVLAAPIALQFGGVSAIETNQRLADHVWTLWHGRVQTAPFRFGSPAVLARDIEDSKWLPTPEAKMRAVLRTVVRSLGVRLHASTRAWLEGTS